MPDRITLYTNEACPWAQRTRIALAEAGATFKEYEVDLQNKPDFYAKLVNPASKVPAIAYGGADVPADQPDPASIKIAESAVLVEFIADLFPDSNLLPKDPTERANIRFFVDLAMTKLAPAWQAWAFRGEPSTGLLQAIEAIQDRLHPTGPFLTGDKFTLAEADVAPFIARLYIALMNDTVFNEGEGTKLLQQLHDPKFKRWDTYAKALIERQSVKTTTPEDRLLEGLKKRIATAKAAQVPVTAAA